MKVSEKSIKKAWIFSNLKGIRDSGIIKTYNVFNYDNLPSVPPNLSDDFNWLIPNEGLSDMNGSYVIEGVDFSEKLEIIEGQAKSLGLILPVSFMKFLSNSRINGKIYSNTDCFFELGDFIEKVTIEDENYYLLHFMSDSQYCYLWYLCFNELGEYFILISEKVFGHDDMDIVKPAPDFLGYYCASSFEEFIYRFAMENQIWVKITFYTPETERETNEPNLELNTEEKEYISHYLNH